MFWVIFRSELSASFRSPAFWIFSLILALFSFMDASNDVVTRTVMTRFGQAWHNAPVFISRTMAIMSIVGVLFSVVLVARTVAKDFGAKIHHFIFTTQTSKFSYLFGRYFAGLLANLLIYIGVLMGLVLGWQSIDSSFSGPIEISPFLFALLVVLLPNLLLVSSIFFSLATLSRKMFLTYIAAIGFMLLYTTLSGIIRNSDNQVLTTLFDPTLLAYLSFQTTNWTIAEINSNPVPISTLLILNRVIWLSISVALLLYTSTRFKLVADLEKGKKKSQPTIDENSVAVKVLEKLPVMPRLFSWSQDLKNSLVISWRQARRIIFHPAFLVLTFFAVRQAYHNFTFNTGPNGSNVYPFTSFYLNQVGSIFGYMIPITIVFGGMLVWRERDNGSHELYNSFPNAPWMNFMSKFLSLTWIQLFYIIAVFIAGILSQAFLFGYFNFEIPLYAKRLLGIDLINYLHMAVMVLFIHNLAGNKYLGYLICAIYYIADLVIFNILGLGGGLFNYGFLPGYQYSNITGFGHFAPLLIWHRIYWLFFGALLASLTYLLWRTNNETSLFIRLKLAWARMGRASGAVMVLLLIGFVSTGAYIYHNTYILNDFSTSSSFNNARERYEKEYKHLEQEPSVTLSEIDLNIDFFPKARTANVVGSYVLINNSNQHLTDIYYNLTNRRITSDPQVEFSGAASVLVNDEETGFYGFKLDKSLKPSDSVIMRFSYQIAAQGFSENNPKNELATDGSFLHNYPFQMPNFFPSMNYNAIYEISDNGERGARGFTAKSIFSDLDDSLALRITMSELVRYSATLSTDDDQIAITNGNLDSTWNESGRNYFRYETDTLMNNMLVMLSGEYELVEDNFQGVDLQIYYHRNHHFNIENMMRGMKASLAYCSSNFGKYPYKDVRIVEATAVGYPGNGTATSQPTIFTWQENGGFISNLEDPESLDVVFSTTTHEMAHQWFGHILRPATTAGVAVLVETLAQWVRLQCLEDEFGEQIAIDFLQTEMDIYLANRQRDFLGEVPMIKTENQAYLNYRKGSVVMNALEEYISEDSVNSALRSLIDKFAFKGERYPTTLDLVAAFRKVTPESLQYVITDLFEHITLFENQATDASYQRLNDGSYILELEVSSRKFRSDGIGNESEIEINDYIPIIVYGESDKVIYEKFHLINQSHSNIAIILDKKPESAGIDPNLILIDRTSENNQIKVRSDGN